MSENNKYSSVCPNCGCALLHAKRRIKDSDKYELVQVWCCICGYFENVDGVSV